MADKKDSGKKAAPAPVKTAAAPAKDDKKAPPKKGK